MDIESLTPPIQMTDHFFSKVRVIANDIPAEDLKGAEFGYDLTRHVSTFVAGEDDDIQVRLTVATERTEGMLLGYDAEIEAVGFFSVSDKVPAEQRLNMAKVLGASLLYSAVREFLYTLTLRGPWDPVYLPTVSFLPAPPKTEGDSPQETPQLPAE